AGASRARALGPAFGVVGTDGSCIGRGACVASAALWGASRRDLTAHTGRRIAAHSRCAPFGRGPRRSGGRGAAGLVVGRAAGSDGPRRFAGLAACSGGWRSTGLFIGRAAFSGAPVTEDEAGRFFDRAARVHAREEEEERKEGTNSEVRRSLHG